jgi:hypothetical protein
VLIDDTVTFCTLHRPREVIKIELFKNFSAHAQRFPQSLAGMYPQSSLCLQSHVMDTTSTAFIAAMKDGVGEVDCCKGDL